MLLAQATTPVPAIDRPTAAKALVAPVSEFSGHVFDTLVGMEPVFATATVADFVKRLDTAPLVASSNAAIEQALLVAPDAAGPLAAARDSINGVLALAEQGRTDTTKLDSAAGSEYPASLVAALEPLSAAALVVDPDLWRRP